MKAVGLYKYLPIDDDEALIDLSIDRPLPGDRDLLVAVRAVSVNPVDTKVRAPKNTVEAAPRVLGWDAAGDVVAVGSNVENFVPGDRVYYAGDITRPGSNAEYQLVDERIVGHMPKSLDYAAAAALPLTGITAWEALFDRLAIDRTGRDAGKSILIVGGAGGVGSIAIQLAHKLAELHIIATASRPESTAWAQSLGADRIINHHEALDEGLQAIGLPQVDYILCLNSTHLHWAAMARAIAPQGRICSIVETPHPLALDLLKSKSASFCWEFMFTRSMYRTGDMIEQHHLLDELAMLIDNGTVKTTLNEVLRPINAKNLREAHARLEQGNSIGKLVLEGWD